MKEKTGGRTRVAVGRADRASDCGEGSLVGRLVNADRRSRVDADAPAGCAAHADTPPPDVPRLIVDAPDMPPSLQVGGRGGRGSSTAAACFSP